MVKRKFSVCLLLLLTSTFSQAQKNEFGFLLGSSISPDAKLVTPVLGILETLTANSRLHSGIAYQGVFAHRLVDAHLAALYLELPIVGTPSREVSVAAAKLGSFSSIYFTPGVRVKLAPGAGLSPFVSLGGGLAHYNSNVLLLGTSTGANTGALEAGAGIDIQTPIPLIALRAEVREFLTGRPPIINSSQTFTKFDTDTQHNVLVGGGIVFRF